MVCSEWRYCFRRFDFDHTDKDEANLSESMWLVNLPHALLCIVASAGLHLTPRVLLPSCTLDGIGKDKPIPRLLRVL
jgi:hypothetical protein